ncbi:MAG: metal-dependent transcriptional regulator [Oscillospiraceae bacterium]|nr:metal-dependent transcriptional regulator [Oscillospiraceae bacterium]
MAVQESGEMYLETILILTQRSQAVRAIDVGEYMGFSKPSVSRALGLLKKNGLAVTDEAGHISLTEAGEKKAKSIYERHTVLTKLFVGLGVDEETAAEDACRIEHYMSDKTFDAIKAHMAKYASKLPKE